MSRSEKRAIVASDAAGDIALDVTNLALFRRWGRRLRAKNLPGEAEAAQSMRDHAHTLSDFLVPTLSIECEPCGRRGRYNVAKLIEQYGDAKLPELRHIL